MRKVMFAALAAIAVTTSASAQAHDDQPPSSSEKPWSQADAYFGKETMADARRAVQAGGGAQNSFYVLFNQLEAQFSDESESLYWNGQASWGDDINKLWIKSEGRTSLNGDGTEDAELQALYSRAISPYWNLQAGVRHDFEPHGLTHGVLALQGLAPYWFEIDASAFLSEKGDLTARFEAEYEFLLTQRLILQPRIEANFSAQDIAERETGSGLNSIDAGLRLRYEFVRELALYLGVEWQSEFGGSRDYTRVAGGDPDQVVVVGGIRTWF